MPHEQVRIYRYTEPGIGSVNTYWVETSSAVLVIDGQRTLSQAKQALAEIERLGKPIRAVFLTHPHPDHFGGIGVFAATASGIPVYSSRTTRESIVEDRWGLVKASHEAVGEDFPRQVTLPDHELIDGQTLEIAGIQIEVRELGAGESECMTALHLPEHRMLFSADAIQDRATAFLLEGRSATWLSQLEFLRTHFRDVGTIYPGHGEPGTLDELVSRQIEYLNTFRELIEEHLTGGNLQTGAEARIAARMKTRYPGYLPVAAIPDLLEKNVMPVAKEMIRTLARY